MLPARLVTGFSKNAHEADMYLKEVKGIQVGVYEIDGLEKSKAFLIPENVDNCLIKEGWEPFLHVRKQNKENVSLYFRQLPDNTMSLYAVVLGPDELVIAEINGNLDKILEMAICEKRLSAVDRI